MSPEVYGNNGEYTYATDDHKALTTGLSQRTSVPACNSLGCKKKTGASKDIVGDDGLGGLTSPINKKDPMHPNRDFGYS
jgi:hypothetical protein